MYLVNASNLHSGGGVQVAASFINEFASLSYIENHKYIFLCSTEVFDNLTERTKSLLEILIYDFIGFRSLDNRIKEIFEDCEVCFTIFGPFYSHVKIKKHITGFANPWLADYKNSIIFERTTISWIKLYFKLLLQWYYFSLADVLIVEQNSVRDKLLCLKRLRDKPIHVVSNAISSLYLKREEWKVCVFPDMVNSITVGYLGRNYTHKNLAILKSVNDVLLSKYSLGINFIFTLTDGEMDSLGFNSISNFYTVGKIKVEQCPSFYAQIDATIFPSRLECFSATPIESIYMDTPVICSDKDFVRDIFGDTLVYFDELSPDSIAEAIFNITTSGTKVDVDTALAKLIVSNLPSSKDRAEKYMEILNLS
ncbi:glycosyltransferase [Vibrio scophthalmi]|uniref:glycosyltransferase n=1 Tax=Vibrio scophthalmi TaxID=45658 RepID=UPI00349F2523